MLADSVVDVSAATDALPDLTQLSLVDAIPTTAPSMWELRTTVRILRGYLNVPAREMRTIKIPRELRAYTAVWRKVHRDATSIDLYNIGNYITQHVRDDILRRTAAIRTITDTGLRIIYGATYNNDGPRMCLPMLFVDSGVDHPQGRYMLSRYTCTAMLVHEMCASGTAYGMPTEAIAGAAILYASPYHKDWETMPYETLIQDALSAYMIAYRSICEESVVAALVTDPLELSCLDDSLRRVACKSAVSGKYQIDIPSSGSRILFIDSVSSVIQNYPLYIEGIATEDACALPDQKTTRETRLLDELLPCDPVRNITILLAGRRDGVQAPPIFPDRCCALVSSRRALPAFFAYDDEHMSHCLLIPSTEQAVDALCSIYDVQDDKLSVPAGDTQLLYDVMSAVYARTVLTNWLVPAQLGTKPVYMGKVDILRFLVAGSEERDDAEGDELFHQFVYI